MEILMWVFRIVLFPNQNPSCGTALFDYAGRIAEFQPGAGHSFTKAAFLHEIALQSVKLPVEKTYCNTCQAG